MHEEAQFIARYASVYVTGKSFAQVGDVLHQRGFNMLAARQTDHGVLVVPHRKKNRVAARVYRQLEPVEAEEKPPEPEPMSLGAAEIEVVTAAVESGAVKPVGLTCRECGAVHPEGVVCVIPIMAHLRCCIQETYAHEGPHEAATPEGVVTHRWIEELVITDLPFNAYGLYEEEEDSDA